MSGLNVILTVGVHTAKQGQALESKVAHITPLVNAALAEAINRMDFQQGTATPGMLVDRSLDFGDIRVTVSMRREHFNEHGEVDYR